jgi:hypothetical protein
MVKNLILIYFLKIIYIYFFSSLINLLISKKSALIHVLAKYNKIQISVFLVIFNVNHALKRELQIV